MPPSFAQGSLPTSKLFHCTIHQDVKQPTIGVCTSILHYTKFSPSLYYHYTRYTVRVASPCLVDSLSNLAYIDSAALTLLSVKDQCKCKGHGRGLGDVIDKDVHLNELKIAVVHSHSP
jgi:hypothetical protein